MKVGTLVKYKMEEWMHGDDPGLGIIVDSDGSGDLDVHFFTPPRCWVCQADELMELSNG